MKEINVNVELNYTCKLVKEENGKYSAHVQGIDIYFGAASVEEAEKKAKIMTKSMINFLIECNNKGR